MFVAPVTRVLAHRGASAAERENTIAAFRRAAELGADGVELDVRLSADGTLVVHHDATLAEPDGRAIAATPAAALPDYVPTLADAIAAVTGVVNIEIKYEIDDEARALAAAVAADPVVREARERVLISSFDLASIELVHRLAADLATAWLVPLVGDDTVDRVVAGGHRALHPWVGVLTADTVRACHDRGVEVNPWTCDDPDRIAELVEWGVDAVITNVPDVALAVRDEVARRG